MLDPETRSSLEAHLVAGSRSRDWLAQMIMAVRTIAAGADFVPLPYARAALGTLVVLLETVDKIKKNREDLRDLCASTVEIVLILRNEIRNNGESAGSRFAGFCEDFMAFLSILQTGLENLIAGRRGVRGRLKEFVGATSIADQIERYKIRVNELRSNFLLLTALETHRKVANISTSMAPVQDTVFDGLGNDFRHVALGDINLLYEISISSKAYKIRVFTAHISGEPSSMTVVKYDDAVEKWKEDFELYSGVRHPNVWQLFGVSTAPGLQALIYHDELIPLATYRRSRRPSSDLVWACVEGMLFKQFKNCSQHHHWLSGHHEQGFEPAICVKRNPPQICLTMPDLENEDECYDLDFDLSQWHTVLFRRQNTTIETATIYSLLATYPPTSLPRTLSQRLDVSNFLSALIPVRAPSLTLGEFQTRLFLGSVVTQICHRFGKSLCPIAYIPNSCTPQPPKWRVNPALDFQGQAEGNRFTFASGTFKTIQLSGTRILLQASIELSQELRDMTNTSWLSQANKWIDTGLLEDAGRYRYGVVDELAFVILADGDLGRTKGISQEAHLFACPISIRYDGSRVGLESAASNRAYWSLDPAGATPLSPGEAHFIGLPRLEFQFLPRANFWHEYHYNALREYSMARGLDPYSDEFTRLLELPLAEKETERPRDTNQECP
ncbi:hypothetical protein B0H16DRAFT_1512687 [Mycena metata]|uniref:Protein kinase domain-containing protein n=1 Tax=Mycena metata TaxID=1033252 RepID=A0AAD7JV10_9AGAR|nr:hypothetical protein B0H16DRAFT_1512687 [Mycena metata]